MLTLLILILLFRLYIPTPKGLSVDLSSKVKPCSPFQLHTQGWHDLIMLFMLCVKYLESGLRCCPVVAASLIPYSSIFSAIILKVPLSGCFSLLRLIFVFQNGIWGLCCCTGRQTFDPLISPCSQCHFVLVVC